MDLGWTREARVACCVASQAPRSVLRLHAVVRVLLPRLLDHVTVVVDELALLALDEALVEGHEDAVLREELNLAAVAARGEEGSRDEAAASVANVVSQSGRSPIA